MSIPAFDTQKAVKAFKEGGFNDTQAEAVVTTMNDVMSQNFATKADLLTTQNDLRNHIEKVRSELKSDIDKLRSEFKSDIDKLRSELKGDIDKLRSELKKEIAEKFEALYKHLWVMGTGIVIANVTMVAAVVTLLG